MGATSRSPMKPPVIIHRVPAGELHEARRLLLSDIDLASAQLGARSPASTAAWSAKGSVSRPLTSGLTGGTVGTETSATRSRSHAAAESSIHSDSTIKNSVSVEIRWRAVRGMGRPVTRPETHYARSGELAIAYQVHGSGDHDLLLNGGTASNIETVWSIPGGGAAVRAAGPVRAGDPLRPPRLGAVGSDQGRPDAGSPRGRCAGGDRRGRCASARC